MTQEEIIKGNKLIAEFMGGKTYTTLQELRSMFNNSDAWLMHQDSLKYNSSWDCLMPVVEKIESLYNDHHGYFAVYISSNHCRIVGTKLHKEIEDIKYGWVYISSDAFDKTKIESTYHSIIEFIEWYNIQINEGIEITSRINPQTSYYNNVRSLVSREEWDKIRKEVYKNAKYKCEICGGNGVDQGFGHGLECHEIWEFNEETSLQILKGLIGLCPMCHKVKHIGLARLKGEGERCTKHLSKVNGISILEAERHIDEAFVLWRERNKKRWTVNISYIKTLTNTIL